MTGIFASLNHAFLELERPLVKPLQPIVVAAARQKRSMIVSLFEVESKAG